MAQAVFDDHPLGDYLRDAGESQFVIPGISPDLERELGPRYIDDDEFFPEWQPSFLVQFVELIKSIIAVVHSDSTSSSPFVERFRYTVISSSLLSPSLATLHSVRDSRSFHVPGKLQHSRTSCYEDSNPASPRTVPSHMPDTSFGAVSLTATAGAVLLAIGYPFLSLLSLLATGFLMFNSSNTDTPKHDMSLTYNSLQDLLLANDSWESTVQDTLNLLEEEERRSIISRMGSPVPSVIRVALYSFLQSTHTQCDNIRHLFSALTSPTELPQLAEMYAPPSPIKPTFSAEMVSRPFSYPISASASSGTTTPSKKRSTWNGSYQNLAEAGSPTSIINRRRERHSVHLRNTVEPLSPFSVTKVEIDETAENENVFTAPSHFGSAALDLHRKHKSAGLDAFRSPPMTTPIPCSPRHSSFSPNSKFTSPFTVRHPLSFTALTISLQGAMAAKRYACAHLLALRFSDDEDDGYWEDVRSVIGLLTSTLIDATSRLAEALEDWERQHILEARLTPDRPCVDDKSRKAGQDCGLHSPSRGNGFAPTLSHISRFAAHIAAITSALDDANEHLEQCVDALKADPAEQSKRSFTSASHRRFVGPVLGDIKEEEPKALQAYERLRRELGLALRECERGREKLLDIVYPSLPILSDEEEEEDLPGLGHDASDESDKPDPVSPRSEMEETPEVSHSIGADVESADDVTSHLLMTSTVNHLPLPGIEEVFEAETGPLVIPFLRERSKLTREERIELAKAKRESEGQGLGLTSKVERWGPGGDVVQELKDVIWKVGERRRKLTNET